MDVNPGTYIVQITLCLMDDKVQNNKRLLLCTV